MGAKILFKLWLGVVFTVILKTGYSNSNEILLDQNNNDKISYYCERAAEFLVSDLELSKKYLDSAEVYIKSDIDSEAITTYYLSRIEYLLKSSQLEKAKLLIIKLEVLGEEHKNQEFKVWAKYYNGYIHRLEGNSAEAVIKLREGLASWKDPMSKVLKHRLYRELASISTDAGNYSEAISLTFTGLELVDTTNYNSIAEANNELGILNYKLGELDNALSFYRKSFRLAKMMDNRILQGNVNNNISRIFKDKGVYDSALYYLNTAIVHYKHTEGERFLPSIYVNMGNVYYSLEKFEEAKKYYFLAKDHPKTASRYNVRTALTINIGMIETKLNNYKESRVLLLEGMEMARKADIVVYRYNALSALSILDSLEGDYLGAISYRDSLIRIQEEMYKEDVKDQLAKLKLDFEVEKLEIENQRIKEKEEANTKIIAYQRILLVFLGIVIFVVYFLIVRLRKKNRSLRELNQLLIIKNQQIEQKNKSLHELNQTKDKFFSIITHDLRGPIGTLIELLKELDDDYETFDIKERQEIIQTLRKSGENTYNLLVNLLDWSRTQRKAIHVEPIETNIKLLIDEVIEVLYSRANNKNIDIQVSFIGDDRAVIDPKMTTAILINLINNAIKFSEQGKQINVSVARDENVLKLTVKDFGIGIPPHIADKLFSLDRSVQRRGTGNEIGTGLGLILTHEFVSMMGGKITLDSQEGIGTQFNVAIPMG
jgi:signal transduction histidine kinase